jgi:DNA repair photolyase
VYGGTRNDYLPRRDAETPDPSTKMPRARELPILPPRGRGTGANPDNRFVALSFEPDRGELDEQAAVATRFFRDSSRTIITRNNSPDVGFEFSINPYRGCEHGCIYCYARPTHEYLGLSAGLDFETKIFVKEDAPALLRRELSSPKWRPTTVAISGVTDAYQPVERRLELTRRCIEVLAEFRNPMSVITKNHLVTRDTDLLAELAADSAASVNLSITTLDPELQRTMEPRTSSPSLRLEAIRQLSAAGIPTGVMIAPVVPGLTDHELPSIVQAAADAGARTIGYIPLRLPHAVSGLFEGWLDAHFPDRKSKVLGRVREIRGGKLNDPRFGSRMRGEGEYAEQLGALFRVACRKAGIDAERPKLSAAAWRGHSAPSGKPAPAQLSLF